MAVRARPVARFLTVIWAPGTGAWLWSMTVPTMAPRKVCARAAPAAAAIRAVAVRSAVSLGMEFGVAHERVAIAFMDGPPLERLLCSRRWPSGRPALLRSPPFEGC